MRPDLKQIEVDIYRRFGPEVFTWSKYCTFKTSGHRWTHCLLKLLVIKLRHPCQSQALRYSIERILFFWDCKAQDGDYFPLWWTPGKHILLLSFFWVMEKCSSSFLRGMVLFLIYVNVWLKTPIVIRFFFSHIKLIWKRNDRYTSFANWNRRFNHYNLNQLWIIYFF